MGLEELIEKCKQNDVNAQEALYKRFAPVLYGICLKYCNCKSRADDLFQESFILIFNKIHQFKHKGSFEGWIKRITINTILASFKKEKYLVPINEEKIEDYIDINDEVDVEEYSLEFLLDKIQKLPNQYRFVFCLYVLDGYSHAEIADILKISEGTSKSNLSRARALLKKQLQSTPIPKNSIQ